jgi:hypothetical protein
MIRRLHLKAQKDLGTSHPFATHRFRTDGKHILQEFIKDRQLYNHLTERLRTSDSCGCCAPSRS